MIRNFCFIVIMICATNAWAHKFKCFATYEDGNISGYAWLSTGSRPVSVPFDVSNDNGEILHKGTTTENGEFSFVPTQCIDHTIKVFGGEGHVATFTVYGEDLPTALSGNLIDVVKEDVTQTSEIETPIKAVGITTRITEAMVAKAVSKEVNKLRFALEEFKEQQRMQDVIGGVGYLLGFAGIAFYFLGVRRKENN